MKKLIFVFLLSSLCVSLFAQNWFFDLDSAKTKAAVNQHPIVLVFQGSDWCAPCMKLEQEVWNNELFINYSKTNCVLVKADFPKRQKNKLNESQQNKNNQLAEKYNSQGYFPLIVLLSPTGQIIETIGYQKIGAQGYIDWIEKAKIIK